MQFKWNLLSTVTNYFNIQFDGRFDNNMYGRTLTINYQILTSPLKYL
jgi:hypothetical protein